MTLDEYFDGKEESRKLFDTLHDVIQSMGSVEMQVTKSQIAFRRRKAFAWAWMPGKYLHGRVAPLVLTVAFRDKDSSPRWKEIVEPSPGRFMHHLEFYSTADVDEEVQIWLQTAWSQAG